MTKALEEFDFFNPETMKQPFEFYERLRNEAPVYQVPGTDIFFVTTYDDVKYVARKHKLFSSEFSHLMKPAERPKEAEEILAEGWPEVQTMHMRDEPAHSRYRKLVNPAFSNKRVRGLADKMQAIVDELIDGLPQQGTVDFMKKLAVPLPVWVIADALGVPRADLPKFKEWSDSTVKGFSLVTTPDEDIHIARQYIEFQEYFANKIEERRRNPADDVVSNLVNSEVDDELPLDVPEILSIIRQILVAGNETTTATLAAGMVHLIQRPDVLEQLRSDPEKVDQFVEEILRLETPSAGMWRIALEDTELEGVTIPRGSRVMIRFASANLDEAKFENPDAIDLERENSKDHMAFGYGIHMCLGHFLARQELVIAFREILDRLESWKLAEGHEELVYAPNVLLRGLGELKLEIVKR